MSEASTEPNEEVSLLRNASELSAKLGVNFVINDVVWVPTLGGVKDLPSDHCFFLEKGPRLGAMLVPSALKGQLDPEEWRPLIASSLALQFKPEIRRVWKTTGRLYKALLWVAVIITLTLSTLVIPTASYPLRGIAIVVALIFAVVLIFNRLILRANTRYVITNLYFKADSVACQLLGKDVLLRTLEKIDALHLRDLEEAKGRSRTIWKRHGVSEYPTITERLARIHSSQSR